MSDTNNLEDALEKLHSPIQEHHIDFLLEEEFASNPSFLEFFIKAAIDSNKSDLANNVSPSILPPHNQWNCRALRSVTTDAGESDVLVVYQSADPITPRVAILIEDKIRASFQDRQAERYRERGETGRGKDWDAFWTTLIAPQKYAHDSAHFDAYIYLETLEEFFKRESDLRSLFKAGVIRRALEHFAATGVQQLDSEMTEFRRFYAELAQTRFQNSTVRWQAPREAYWGDYWFEFRSEDLPKNAYIVHKPKMAKTDSGLVHLTIRNTSVDLLQNMLENSTTAGGITAVPTGKSASFQLKVPAIKKLERSTHNEPLIESAFSAVEKLLQFWEANKNLFRVR